jgi:hypothetical protein
LVSSFSRPFLSLSLCWALDLFSHFVARPSVSRSLLFVSQGLPSLSTLSLSVSILLFCFDCLVSNLQNLVSPSRPLPPHLIASSGRNKMDSFFGEKRVQAGKSEATRPVSKGFQGPNKTYDLNASERPAPA